MQRYLPAIDRAMAGRKWTGSTSALRQAITDMEREAGLFSASRDGALVPGAMPRARQVAVNTALLGVERALTRPEGLKTRPWFRNLIYVADENNGYANMVFPSVNEAIRAGDEQLTATELADLTQRFAAATRALMAARAALQQ